MEKYHEAVDRILKEIMTQEGEKIKNLANRIYHSFKSDGLIYAFGTGHSHMLVEELFYRAGGLVPVYPVLVSSLMLHEGAVRSSRLEKLDGYGEIIAESLDLKPNDVVMIFSNSGVNSVPVEFAMVAKRMGTHVTAITSFDHANMVGARNRFGKKLHEIVDLAIDNHVPYGDAVLEINGMKVAPLSSISGIFILNCLVSEIADLFAKSGETPPVFVSSNVEGGDKMNKKFIEKYSKLIPSL
ncbi:MAG: hypothetical protein DRP30_01420 [Thermotoga sp.]|nr:MAG: hypothetical protein DRP30_01420 [Thermotoga sp.]HDM70198.1 sugar isomerase domain-containing protein [Thermotogales bacterium]